MKAAVQGEMAGMPLPWGNEDTERYLRDHPLPADFCWRGKIVCPRYKLSKGYGFWLRTTPYHPGLFEALNRFIATCDHYPTVEEMTGAMRALEAGDKMVQDELQL